MNSGANDQPGKLDQLVRAEQARILYAGIRVAVVSGPASAAVLMALFWSVVTRGRLLFVGAFIVTVLTPLSLWLYQAYVRGYRGPSDAQRWLKLQEVRFFFASLAYGSAGALWFTPDSLTYQLILFCFLFALSATLMQEVAHHRPLILLTFPRCYCHSLSVLAWQRRRPVDWWRCSPEPGCCTRARPPSI